MLFSPPVPAAPVYRTRHLFRLLAGLVSLLFVLSPAVFIPPTIWAQPFLAPEKIFQPRVEIKDPHQLIVHFDIEKGHYLYKNKMQFAIEPEAVKPAAVSLPSGMVKDDPAFGRTEIYRDALRLNLPILREDPHIRDISLAITYQGCSDRGLCYPPKVHRVTLQLPALEQDTAITSLPSVPPSGPAPKREIAEPTQISRWLSQKGLFWTLLSFFGFGLLLSLTPCVFPMVPILSGIIVSQGPTVTKKRGLILSAAYVLGMALTYALAGVLAGLSGSMLAAFLENPWVLGAFALIFILLALSMFGLYELQLPGRLQTRLSQSSNRLSGGSLLGVFLMGALSALIIGPCVTAPLAGALLFISRTRNVWLGGSSLFVLALGMGVPLLIIGTSAGALLPKAGSWMETVKQFFGFVLLGVALWLLSPFLPLSVLMLLTGILFVVGAVWMGALNPIPKEGRDGSRLGKALGVVVLVIGTAYLAGALSGARDFYRPLSALSEKSTYPGADSEAANGLSFQPVNGINGLESLLQSSPDRLTLLYFGAEWCTACKVMERTTFRDTLVREKLRGFRLLKVDLTDNRPETQALLKKFDLFGPPALLVFDREGREIPQARMIGEQTAGELLERLERGVQS